MLRKVWWFVSDCIYPRAQRPSKAESENQRRHLAEEAAECTRRIGELPDDETILRNYLSDCEKLLEAEEQRRQSVDARLTSIMGLSSIAATIVFGAIFAQLAGSLHFDRTWLRWAMVLGSFYLALQLCAAILAAVRGLGRQAYLAETTSNVFPLTGESQGSLVRRRITDFLTRFSDHRSLNNNKVTHMAVAHRALQNFLWVLLLLALVGAYGSITQSRPGDAVIETLRKNTELQQILRGPQGPPGPPGPMGPKGESYESQPDPSPKNRPSAPK